MRTARADWQAVVLVCGKCTRKVKSGFGTEGGTPLHKALRNYACGGKRKGRKAAIGAFEIGCLKVCPKNAVMVVDGKEPGSWLIVPARTPVDVVAA
jgi:predicted metal-binding protein